MAVTQSMCSHFWLSIYAGEWWNNDTEAIEREILKEGGPFPLADAVTMNGLPGTDYNCSKAEGKS